jgi:hypothetical protein
MQQQQQQCRRFVLLNEITGLQNIRILKLYVPTNGKWGGEMDSETDGPILA